MTSSHTPSIELVFFAGCPHVELARTALRTALEEAGFPQQWTEWDQHNAAAPERVRGYASPTILVAGRDVTGAPGTAEGNACRADGVPSPEVIRAALTQSFPKNGGADSGQ